MLHRSDAHINEAKSQILWLIASGEKLPDTLDRIAHLLQSASPGLRVAILPLESEPDSERSPILRFGCAPSMGEEYRSSVDGIRLRAGSSPSADAILRKERVLIRNGETDSRYASAVKSTYRRFGISACYVEPLRAPHNANHVVGVLCLYPPLPGPPTAEHLTLMSTGAELAALAIAQANVDNARERSEAAISHVLSGVKCLLWYATVRMPDAALAGKGGEASLIWDSQRLSNPQAAQEFLPLDTTAYDGSYARAFLESRNSQDLEAILRAANRAVSDGAPTYQLEYRVADRTGIIHWLREDVRITPTATNTWELISVCTDVTERKRAEQTREAMFAELMASREQYRNLFQNVPTGVYRSTPDGRVLLANPALARMLGYKDSEEMYATINLEAKSPNREAVVNRAEFRRAIEEAGELRGYEAIWTNKDGDPVLVRENSRVVRAEDGTVLFYEGTVEDITEIRRVEGELRKQATHDTLTGLPNRAQVLKLLTQAVQLATETGKGSEVGTLRARDENPAVLFIDLDRFKQVNDTLGHAAGDLLLKTMAKRFQALVDINDTVARLGGDEFVVLLPSTSEENALKIARDIRNTATLPVLIEGQEVFVAGSVGIAIWDEEERLSADALLQNADTAMYFAKGEGGDGVAKYAPEMGEAVRYKATLEVELRRALRYDELSVVYQPQFDLVTGRMIGAESLIRWFHQERGFVPPKEFVGIAEETGLIEPMGEWIIRQACLQGVEWSKTEFPLRVAVNLSARQFHPRNKLAEQVARILKETGFNPHLLDLEITESVLLTQNAPVSQTLADLKDLGVRLLLDDFGTGYGSLLYLRQFPLDVLKVDRSFVSGLSQSSEDAAIVRAVIDLAHALGMHVIAEGVETDEQRAELALLGCDALQGYLLARPLEPQEITERLDKNTGEFIFASSFATAISPVKPLL